MNGDDPKPDDLKLDLDNVSLEDLAASSEETDSEETDSEDHPPDNLKNQDATEKTKNAKANRKLRNEYAKKAYSLSILVILGWFAMLFIDAITNICGCRAFSDNIMYAITTAASINLFAAFLTITRSLFPATKE